MSTNWSLDETTIVSPGEEHMALLFLCDVSGSMTKEVESNKRRIDVLNDALAGFAPEVCKDPKTKRTLEVSIVAFDHNQQIIQDWTNVGDMEQMSFKPLNSSGGGTKIAAAAQFALDGLDVHVRKFTNKGTQVRKPWVLMVTDGFPEHDTPDELDRAISRVKDLDARDKLRFWSFGVGEYDRDTLVRFSGERAIALQGYNFRTMIDWTVKSMRALSAAAPGQTASSAPIDPAQGMQQVVTLPG